MNHLTSYQKGNKQMHGELEFTWIPGAPYLESPMGNGEVAIIPIYGLMFQVKA